MNDIIHIFDSAECKTLNAGLATAILALSNEDFDKRSHFFHGRYENLYLDSASLAGLNQIIETALFKAAGMLQQGSNDLKPGFWLNIMKKWNITTLHSHDDDDEILSAVYYVQVPEHSGLLKLHHDSRVHELIPIEGRFIFFDPALPHEVSEHQSETPRISIGINFGLKP